MGRLGVLGIGLGLAAAAACLVLVAGAAASAGVTYSTSSVTRLAADGHRVVVAVTGSVTECDRLVLWTPRSRPPVVFRAGTNCPRNGGIGGDGIVEVALAGTRVAWVERALGNFEYLTLYTRSPGAAKGLAIAAADNASGAKGGVDGDYLGHVRGDGSMLVFDRWSICTAYPPGSIVEPPPAAPCDTLAPTEVTEVTYDEQLFRVGRKAPIATGVGSILAADAGRIVVHGAGGDVVLLDRTGAVLRTLSFLVPTSFDAAALDGHDLVLQRGTALDVYDTSTGERTSTLAVPAGARLTDAALGRALAVSGSRVLLLRLDGTGTEAFVAPRRVVDAELEPDGLFYAYNLAGGSRRGRVVFVAAPDLS